MFYATRSGSSEIFHWYYGQGGAEFFKARGEQNYEGQTIEHIACMTRETDDIINSIKPRADIRDYHGNLPLFYAIQRDDVQLVTKLFKKGRDYYNMRNYRNKTIFHIAAKTNALESLKVLINGSSFSDEILKKDYKGNTPLHIAAKKGSI